MHKGILSKHKYKITQGKDGRWRTNIMVDGKRKMIVRKDRRKLEEDLEEFYGVDDDISMRELYPEWLEYKSLHVAEPTIIRLQKRIGRAHV